MGININMGMHIYYFIDLSCGYLNSPGPELNSVVPVDDKNAALYHYIIYSVNSRVAGYQT